jgi:hypothetical protein
MNTLFDYVFGVMMAVMSICITVVMVLGTYKFIMIVILS